MRPTSRARAAFLLLYGALLAWQIDRWFFTPHGLVSTWSYRYPARVVSAGSPRGLTQSFQMGADGLDGVWLKPTGEGVSSGDLLVDLLEVRGEARVRIERVAMPASDAARETTLHVPFRPVRQSRGRAYQLDLRHVNAGAGPALQFAATREDTLQEGRLFADAVEQWGDLAFETSARRASLPYWIDEILRPWPAWVRARSTVVLAIVLVNGLLAYACALAVGLVGVPDATHARRPAGRAGLRATRHGGAAAVGMVVVAGLVIVVWPVSPRAIDLIAAIPDAHVEASRPVHDVLHVQRLAFGGRVYDALISYPPGVVEWTLDVPRGARFTAGVSQRADLWAAESDGFTMKVQVVHAGRTHDLAVFDFYPYGIAAHRALHRADVPLDAWAGRRIQLRLLVHAGAADNRVNDVPVWTEPAITWTSRDAGGVVLRR